MHVAPASDPVSFEGYIARFIDLIGRERWFKRAGHLDLEQRRSFNRWKIVADYHWLEMAISFQADVLEREARLFPELMDELVLASLKFAASAVEVHARLSSRGRQVLEGRLRDALKAETGFAPVYLEIDLAQRLMSAGYDVEFTDLEGTSQFDLLFSRGSFTGEVECKSLSADAGRQIHRKDFYRFMESLTPALTAHSELERREVLVISLEERFSPNTAAQATLLRAATDALKDGGPVVTDGPKFRLERKSYAETLADAPTQDATAFYNICKSVFGPNIHVSGSLTEESGCLVVMRSRRDDDTSKAMLEALRKASRQFSGKRPAFIAIQEHGIAPADLLLPDVRRRAAILSYALFNHYGCTHVSATSITAFGAVVVRDGLVETPGFSILNPKLAYPTSTSVAAPSSIPSSDADFVVLIDAPLPAPEIFWDPIQPAKGDRSAGERVST